MNRLSTATPWNCLQVMRINLPLREKCGGEDEGRTRKGFKGLGRFPGGCRRQLSAGLSIDNRNSTCYSLSMKRKVGESNPDREANRFSRPASRHRNLTFPRSAELA